MIKTQVGILSDKLRKDLKKVSIITMGTDDGVDNISPGKIRKTFLEEGPLKIGI